MIDQKEVLIKAHLMCSNEETSKEDIKYIKNALAMALNIRLNSNETTLIDYLTVTSKQLHDSNKKIERLEQQSLDYKEENSSLHNKISVLEQKNKELKNNNVHEILREREVLFWVLRKQMLQE